MYHDDFIILFFGTDTIIHEYINVAENQSNIIFKTNTHLSIQMISGSFYMRENNVSNVIIN